MTEMEGLVMKGSRGPHYNLIIGDLSIGQVLMISAALQRSDLSAFLKNKASRSVEGIWQVHVAYRWAHKLWLSKPVAKKRS